MTSTELGIPERWIVWVDDHIRQEWIAFDSPFHRKDRAIEAATGLLHRSVVVSTATGDVVWDSEKNK